MNEYHGCKHADLKLFGTENGSYLHTLITDDGLNIIVMERWKGYNVYNIKSDSWLLKENLSNCYELGIPSSNGRCLFLDNQLLVSSQDNSVTILDLSDIIAPKKIFQHEIKSEIEMCLIKYANNLISFLLFGLSEIEQQHNVIKVDIVVSKLDDKWKIESVKDEIVQNAPIDKFPEPCFHIYHFVSPTKKNNELLLCCMGEIRTFTTTTRIR